jgi:TMEM175 potassium channel family protein
LTNGKPAPGVMGFTVERVNALSDGVFAVAITLLAVGIAVPTIRGTVTNAKLAHGLAELWPHFFSYFLSFVIIAMFWMSHHSLFSVIRRVDKMLIWMNIFYLLLIVFMPYPTILLSLYGKTAVATALYASVLAAAGILQGTMGLYAVRGRRLVDDDFDLREAGAYLRNAFMMSCVFIISIGIAFASPTIAQLSWLLLFLIPLVERLILKNKHAEPGIEAQEA